MTESARIRSHRDLKVWQLRMEITEYLYRVTSSFPTCEQYGITSQLRRAAASVPANIAEGNAKSSTRDYLRHLSIAIGSLAEVETFLELSLRLGYCDANDAERLSDLIGEERRMVRGLQRSLRTKSQ